MTLREKIAEVSPSDVSDNYEGGVNGCPCQYPETKKAPTDLCGVEPPECEACWNQLWKEEYRG